MNDWHVLYGKNPEKFRGYGVRVGSVKSCNKGH